MGVEAEIAFVTATDSTVSEVDENHRYVIRRLSSLKRPLYLLAAAAVAVAVVAMGLSLKGPTAVQSETGPFEATDLEEEEGPEAVKIFEQCGGGQMKKELPCKPGCICTQKNKYFSMCKPPKGHLFCDKKAVGDAAQESRKHAQELQDKESHYQYVFDTTEKKLWKAKGSADWYKKKAAGAAAYAGKMWWQLNETKKEPKCAKYGNCKAVDKVLKQANKAQKAYDDVAKIMTQKNILRDSILHENQHAKSMIEKLKPMVKAAWDAHAKWHKALHLSMNKTAKKHHGHEDKHHKGHVHTSEKGEDEHHRHHDHEKHHHDGPVEVRSDPLISQDDMALLSDS